VSDSLSGASPRTKKRKNALDFAAVDLAARQDCLQAVAQAFRALTKTELSAGEVTFYRGLPSNVPLDLTTALSVPVTVSAGDLEVEAAFVLSKEAATALVNLMIGEEIGAPLTSFNELHRSVIVEAVAGVLPSLQAALRRAAGSSLELATSPTVESGLGALADNVLAFAGTSLTDGKDFSGGIALVIEEAGCLELIESKPDAEPAKASFAGLPQLRSEPAPSQGKNLGILLDVPMQMVAVLGRRGVKLRDLLQMGPGSILELDKLAGEPLELLVNGKLIGYGEVIVLDEKFGIKVRDVVNPEDRLRSANL
jgi:flagellar motor switch protein FliN